MIQIMCGDCVEVMRGMEPDSVDAIVTDPPAGIAFMGKDWDKNKGGRDSWIEWMQGVAAECLRVLKPGGHALVWAIPRTSHWTATAWENAGFEIRDRIAHVFGSGFPKSLDVSKAIDKAAGAEREVIGPSKRHAGTSKSSAPIGDLARFADSGMVKTAPSTDAARQWEGWGTALKPAIEDYWLLRKPLSEGTVAANVLKFGCGGINVDASRIRTEDQQRDDDACIQLSSLCSALGTPSLPLSFCLDVLQHIVSVLRSCSTGGKAHEHNVGGLGDILPGGARVAQKLIDRLLPSVDVCALNWSSVPDFQGDCPSCRRLCDALLRRAQEAALTSVPSLLDALSDTCCRLRELERNHGRQCIDRPSSSDVVLLVSSWLNLLCVSVQDKHNISLSPCQQGRWPAHLIHSGEDEVLECFPVTTSGKPGIMRKGTNDGAAYGAESRLPGTLMTGFGDTGSASRFFQCCPDDDVEDIEARRIVYFAKASRGDRNDGCENMEKKPLNWSSGDQSLGTFQAEGTDRTSPNFHPTVKATSLMRYLCRLITPPKTVLDPFMGSGSTGKAAVLEGFRFIGIEQDAEYCKIAEARIAHAQKQITNGDNKSKPKKKAEAEDGGPLFCS